MGKILHWKIKYNYVMRYRQGESPTKLGREINPNLKNPLENILIWNKKYENEGIIGLVPKNSKKKKIDYENWTKEDLINLEKLRDDFEKWKKEHHHNHCRAFLYEYIENCKFKLSKKKICLCLGVAESSFYKWKKQGFRNKYDPVLLFRIALLFFKFKKVFGFRRITIYLFRIYGIKINKKTTYRYMKHLGLASIIRKPKRKPKEDKNTKFVGDNLINRNFKAEKPFEKIFTDVTYLKINNKWYHLSVTIDGFNNELIDHKLSAKNDTKLIMDNIRATLKKCGGKTFIIHNDHATVYTSKKCREMAEKGLFKQSFSRVANSLDNRPAEYFFNVFKTECWQFIAKIVKNVKEAREKINKFANMYNNERIQGCLDNLTPVEYRKLFIKLKKI